MAIYTNQWTDPVRLGRLKSKLSTLASANFINFCNSAKQINALLEDESLKAASGFACVALGRALPDEKLCYSLTMALRFGVQFFELAVLFKKFQGYLGNTRLAQLTLPWLASLQT